MEIKAKLLTLEGVIQIQWKTAQASIFFGFFASGFARVGFMSPTLV
jgi:hypothetical protein